MLRDSSGLSFNAVLPLTPPTHAHIISPFINTRLMRALHAVIITRNPSLTVAQQRIALLCTALTQLLRQMMFPAFQYAKPAISYITLTAILK